MTDWNPRNFQLSTSDSHHSTTKYRCSVASPLTFASNYSANSEELVNFVQRHTKFSKSVFGYVHESATCNADCGILKFIICQIFIPQSAIYGMQVVECPTRAHKISSHPTFCGMRDDKIIEICFCVFPQQKSQNKNGIVNKIYRDAVIYFHSLFSPVREVVIYFHFLVSSMRKGLISCLYCIFEFCVV